MIDINPYSEEGRRLMGEKGLMYDPLGNRFIQKKHCEVVAYLRDDDRTRKGRCRKFATPGEAEDFAKTLMTADGGFVLWEEWHPEDDSVQRDYIRASDIVAVSVRHGVRE